MITAKSSMVRWVSLGSACVAACTLLAPQSTARAMLPLGESGPRLVEIMHGFGPAPDVFISPAAPDVPLQDVPLTFDEPVMLEESNVASTADPSASPFVLDVRHEGGGSHTLLLSDAIPVGHWLQIELVVASKVTGLRSRVRLSLAQLPCDVDQSGMVDVRDATRFGSEFRGRRAPQLVDLNGDGRVDVKDATEFGRLWHGADGTGRWSGATLPSPDNASLGAALPDALDSLAVFAEGEGTLATALLVSREFYDAAAALPAGAPIEALSGLDGYEAFLAAITDSASPGIAAAIGALDVDGVTSNALEIPTSIDSSGDRDFFDGDRDLGADGDTRADDDLFGADDAVDDIVGSNGDDELNDNDNRNPNGDGQDDGGEDAPESRCLCKWIITQDNHPVAVEVTQYSRFWHDDGRIFAEHDDFYPRNLAGVGLDAWYVWNGVGPYHQIRTRRNHANCHSPETAISRVAAGEYTADLNVLCFDENGRKCEVKCESKVHVLGFYESDVSIRTTEGAECRGGNKIEAIAQDETQLTVNGGTVFNKAVAVQNGNDVSTTLSYEFGANVGASTKDGLSANVSASFGFSQTTTKNTGAEADALKAEGTTMVGVPTHVHLQSKGRGQLNAQRRSAGWTVTDTQVWGVVYVGESDCPGAGTTFGGTVYGLAGPRQARIRRASNFIKVRTGTDPVWK